MMNGRGKSDRPIQPTKPPNKAEGPAAEAVEGRGLAEGNSLERNALRTQRRGSAISALERVRQAARRHRQQRFTALLHHVYDSERWRAAYLGIKRDAAAGVDDETWRHYGEALEENLQDLSQRLKRGAYRAQPVRRAYIRKTAGLKHEWLVKFVEHRVADRRIVRLIQKWLAAGVLEDGQRTQREVGTVQGGSISPLLANLYLHYVFDLWVRQWRQKQARGDVIVVRFADDFVVGFEHRHEAERFVAALRERFAPFGLELHPDKTRLLRFGRLAASSARARREGKPQTFNFLGFTHCCAKTRKGRFTVLRLTMRKRWQAKLQAVKAELKRRLHTPVRSQGAYVRAVVLGHVRYSGVPMNGAAIGAFRQAIGRVWWRVLRRRSQGNHLSWRRMTRYLTRWLPPAHICHPYPLVRLGVITHGKSRMR